MKIEFEEWGLKIEFKECSLKIEFEEKRVSFEGLGEALKSEIFITLSSGLALWSLQIKKRSLMGYLFFDSDFYFFSFWPIKLADLPNLGF